ncbi:MAG TPA: hypothetical protein VE079_13970 [Ensifer sp.]|nr:hypothetical protein [Ensifer sp.]
MKMAALHDFAMRADRHQHLRHAEARKRLHLTDSRTDPGIGPQSTCMQITA